MFNPYIIVSSIISACVDILGYKTYIHPKPNPAPLSLSLTPYLLMQVFNWVIRLLGVMRGGVVCIAGRAVDSLG